MCELTSKIIGILSRVLSPSHLLLNLSHTGGGYLEIYRHMRTSSNADSELQMWFTGIRFNILSKIVTFFPFNSLLLKTCNSILLSMVYAVGNVCSLRSLFNLCDYFESE